MLQSSLNTTTTQALGGFDLEKPTKDVQGRFSLNDLHRMSGSPSNREPKEWAKLDTVRDLVEVVQIQQNQNGGKSPVIEVLKTKKGKGGGTWATLAVTLAYAKYLSPEFHAAALQVLVERIEETADPELGIARARERASKMWKRTGKGNAWIVARLDGIDTRNTFTSACAERGVKDYKLVTNGVYTGLFGKTARELRVRMGLPDGANVRDAMDETQLIATRLAENLTIRKAQEQKLWGDGEIADAANHCGRGIQTAIRAALSAA